MPRQSTPKRRGRPRKISNVISDESEADYQEESQEEVDLESSKETLIGKRHQKKIKYNEEKSYEESEDSTEEVQVEDDQSSRPVGRTKRPIRATMSDEGEVTVEDEDNNSDGNNENGDDGEQDDHENESEGEKASTTSSSMSSRSPSSRRHQHQHQHHSRPLDGDLKEEQEAGPETQSGTELEYLGNEAYEEYMTKLEDFLREKRKNPFVRQVPIGQVTVNLYKLAQSVESHGGVFKLTADKSWRLVAKDFNMPPSYTNGSYLLKQLYIRQLYDFDVHRGKISEEQIGANVHLSGGPSPLSGSPRSASPANFTSTPRHALTRNQPSLSVESRRTPSNTALSSRPLLSSSTTATISSQWQTPNGKLVRPLMIKSTPGVTNASHHQFVNMPPTGTTAMSYPTDTFYSYAPQHGKQATITSSTYPSSTPTPLTKNYDAKFLEALKTINLNHFQGGPKSRIFKALECSLPNEIDWAFQHILEFSNILEQAILYSQQPATGSYYQHPSASNSTQHQVQLIVQLGRNFIASGLLDRILVHANPFFQVMHALLTTDDEKSDTLMFFAYDAAIMKALNAISNSAIYGISFEHLLQGHWKQPGESEFAKHVREKKQLLEIILTRMMNISVILHNLTFSPVEDIRLLLSLKAFKLYLSKGLALIRLFAAVATPLVAPVHPAIAGSRRVYGELTRAFTPQWIDIGNLVLETMANVSTLMDLKIFPLDLYFLPFLNLAMHSKDRYYTMTALDTITRWLISDTNAELLFPKLTQSGLLDYLATLLVVPDNDLVQSVLEFLFQYFDIAVSSQLAISEAFIDTLLPILFDVLYDTMEFPAKSVLLKNSVSYNQNLFNTTMTTQQKSIKWIAVAYQAGASNEIITARDLFHQYAEFSKRENIVQSLTNQDLFNLLTQIYPKSIPPRNLWESSSSSAPDKSAALPPPAVHDKPSPTDPMDTNKEKKMEGSFSCFWQDCSLNFPLIEELQHHLVHDHAQTSENMCHWMSCSCRTVDARHLKSHVLTHILTTSKQAHQRKGSEPTSLPQFFYLKPRSMAESSIKVNEKASYIMQILSQMCRLSHIIPTSQREFAEFSETEASQCIILHAFLPFLEKICVYWTIEHSFVLKYVTSILSHLKLFHARYSKSQSENMTATPNNGILFNI